MDVKTHEAYKITDESGTSANAYTTITIDFRGKTHFYGVLSNSGVSNGITYTVNKCPIYDGSLAHEEVAASNIAAGAQVELEYNDIRCAKILIAVKSQTEGNHSTYALEAVSAD